MPTPLDRITANNNYGTCLTDIDGSPSKFLIGFENTGNYMLKPGKYIFLAFTDKPGAEKKFALTFSTVSGAKLSCK